MSDSSSLHSSSSDSAFSSLTSWASNLFRATDEEEDDDREKVVVVEDNKSEIFDSDDDSDDENDENDDEHENDDKKEERTAKMLDASSTYMAQLLHAIQRLAVSAENDYLLSQNDDDENFEIVEREIEVQRLVNGADRSLKVRDVGARQFLKIREAAGVSTESYVASFDFDHSQLPKASLGAGRSGSLFVVSRDRRMLFKTLPVREARRLVEIVPHYVRHMRKFGGDSRLLRFFGLYRFQRAMSVRAVWGVTFNNLFYTEPLLHSIDEKYDLKGRVAKRGKAFRNVGNVDPAEHVFKDNDLTRAFVIDAADRAKLLAVLKSDTEFLARQGNVMDYSILVGVHHRQGNDVDAVPAEAVAAEAVAASSPSSSSAGSESPQPSLRTSSVEALRHAVRHGSVEVLCTLINAQPELVNVRSKHALETALHRAAWCSNADMVAALLQRGACATLENRLGLTPLHLAAARGSFKSATLLVKQGGADVNAQSGQGNTPLHRAFHHGRHKFARRFVAEFGADPSLQNKRGELAYPPLAGSVETVVVEADAPVAASSSSADDAEPSPAAVFPLNPMCIPSADGAELFYVGVIDLLSHFGKMKRSENLIKRVVWPKEAISVSEPTFYAQRLLDFAESRFLEATDERVALLRAQHKEQQQLQQQSERMSSFSLPSLAHIRLFNRSESVQIAERESQN
jgi:Phosphatidylinositol-4-phosphate 5-Kinase/Ankyrin repeats (3 copies)